MKKIIALFGISLFLSSFTTNKEEWEIWEDIKSNHNGEAYVYKIMQRLKKQSRSSAWLVPEYAMDILPELEKSSIGHRKNFYRLYVYKSLNKSTRMSLLSMNASLTNQLLEQDFDHFYKYLECVATPQLQFCLSHYIVHQNSNLEYDERSKVCFPKELLKLKSLERRVYLIARAEFNKLKSNHRVIYKSQEKYRRMKRNMRKKD